MLNPNNPIIRYPYKEDKYIPKQQQIKLAIRGEQISYSEIVSGKYRFVMDAGYFHFLDPLGAGIVKSIERGLIGKIEIGVVE